MVDGTGRPAYRADLFVEAGRIAAIRPVEPDAGAAPLPTPSCATIDASGCVVAPGFIDIHTHSDLVALRKPNTTDKLAQGVTTDVLGNCGYALFPVVEETREVGRDMLANLWGPLAETELFTDLDSYCQGLQQRELSYNVVPQASAAMVRIAVLGGENRAPTHEEQKRMDRLLEAQLDDGACGVSSGLIYAPGCYAECAELTSLARIAARCGKMVSSHIRGEGDTLDVALDEAIRTARDSDVSFEISHLKAVGPRQWGTIARRLEWLDSRIAEGIRLHFDSYPYQAGSTTLAALLPPYALQGGMGRAVERLGNPATRKEILAAMREPERLLAQIGAESVLLTAFRSPDREGLVGKTVAEVAELWSADPAEVICDLVARERGMVTTVLFQTSREDVETVFRHPRQMIGSDGIPSAEGRPHPRQFATYVRILEEYVRKGKLCTLETAIRKMTALPAEKIGLADRGRLMPGLAADITIFDFAAVHDPTDYHDPFAPVEGIRYVLVNGDVAIERGTYTGATSGRTLRIPNRA